MNKKYKIIALTGPAGSGKDTLIYELFNDINDNKIHFNRIIRSTTRPERETETNHINYHFYTEEEFQNLKANNKFLDIENFNGWYYGINYEDLDINKINIGEFNPYSLLQIAGQPNIDLSIFYITAKDKTRLIRQLSREEEPNVQEIIRRYGADQKDFEILYSSILDYTELINETPTDLHGAVKAIKQSLWDNNN